MSDDRHFVPVAEACRIIGKSDRTLRRWVEAGKLTAQESADGLLIDVAGIPLAGVALPNILPTVPSAELEVLRSELVRVTALLEATAAERDRLIGLVASALTTRPALQSGESPYRERTFTPYTPRWWPFSRRAEA